MTTKGKGGSFAVPNQWYGKLPGESGPRVQVKRKS
jgi:hypothetical protein